MRIAQAVVLALPLFVGAAAHAVQEATLRAPGRVRAEPGRESRVLTILQPGSTITVLDEEQRGWRRVQLPDGTTGFVWGEHLALAAPGVQDAAAAAAATTTVPPPTAAPAGDELRALRDDLDALRQRPAAASVAEIEQLRAEVRALAAAQRDLARRLQEVPHEAPRDASTPTEAPGAGAGARTAAGDDRPSSPLRGPSPEGGIAAAVTLVLAGGAVGWLVARIAQRRRDRRGRIRI